MFGLKELIGREGEVRGEDYYPLFGYQIRLEGSGRRGVGGININQILVLPTLARFGGRLSN